VNQKPYRTVADEAKCHKLKAKSAFLFFHNPFLGSACQTYRSAESGLNDIYQMPGALFFLAQLAMQQINTITPLL
jgi:hypothetical protein